jgi:acyl carrier protein
MKTNKILRLISEALEVEVTEDSMLILLDNIDEYDSMGILMIMESLEQEGVDLFPEDFKNLITVSDLINVIYNK